MAAGMSFGIMLALFIISSAFEFAGVWGLVLLVVVIVIGFAIAAFSDNGGKK